MADAKDPHHKGKSSALHCVVVTPEKTLMDDVVDFVALPLDDGELGILPGRSPLIGRLGIGELRTRTGGSTQRYMVEGGFAQVRDNVVTVLTNHALAADKIELGEATKDLELAQGKRGISDAEVAEKTKAVRIARTKLRLAGKK